MTAESDRAYALRFFGEEDHRYTKNYTNATIEEARLGLLLRGGGMVIARYFEHHAKCRVGTSYQGVELLLRGVELEEGLWDSARNDTRVVTSEYAAGDVSRKVYTFDENGMLNLPYLHPHVDAADYSIVQRRTYRDQIDALQNLSSQRSPFAVNLRAVSRRWSE